MDDAWFRQQYEADDANRQRQSWDEYSKWVRTFYEGKRFPPLPGWNDRERQILDRLPSDARADLQRALDDTGRWLAAEWAKDNKVRKVGTNDLQDWGRRFGDAAHDPKRLHEALEQVRAEVEKRRA